MILGKSRCVTITSAKGKTTDYQQISFIGADNRIRHVLLTEREISAGSSRALKNIVHLKVLGFLDSVLAFFLRLL